MNRPGARIALAWSVFVAPLEKEFGWKRAETSLVFTIAVASDTPRPFQ